MTALGQACESCARLSVFAEEIERNFKGGQAHRRSDATSWQHVEFLCVVNVRAACARVWAGGILCVCSMRVS